MSLPAQKFRELLFQMLYSYTIGGTSEEAMVDLFSKELSITRKTVREALQYLHAILQNLNEIDQLIQASSLEYAFERIQTVEKNILRVALYELFYKQEIPKKVAIAEAKRLAKKFSTPESASFVHAILDAVCRARLGEQAD